MSTENKRFKRENVVHEKKKKKMSKNYFAISYYIVGPFMIDNLLIYVESVLF